MVETNALLLAGVVAPLLFVVTFLIDGQTRPEYRPTYHVVSGLALGPRGWIQTSNFIVCGLLITISALGIHEATSSVWLSGVIAIFGLALFASGIFPMDPTRGYPPGAPIEPTEFTRAHKLHDLAGIVVFATLPIAAGVAAFTLDSTPWAIYSGLTALATAVAFFVFGWAMENAHPRAGLIQRITIIVGWLWLAATCAHLMI